MPRPRRRNTARSREVRASETANIETLAHDGRGVARVAGKTVFTDGALPGERVVFRYRTERRNYDEGQVEQVLEPSPFRVEPCCPHFGVCGGCTLQHLLPSQQILAKQDILLDNLGRIGKLTPETILPPLTGPHWGYRRRARLSVRYVPKKGKVVVGFCERRSSLVADLQRCEVLHPAVGEHLNALAELVGSLDARDRIPQIEVAVADNAAALVFRHLVELTDADRGRLQQFGQDHGLHIYLQPAGPDTTAPLHPVDSVLTYRPTADGPELRFEPTDFVQINFDINRKMVVRALELLQLDPATRVLDLFCGIGNFSLPVALHAGDLVGIEGDASLVRRARDNAQHNGIDNAQFHAADLTADVKDQPWARQQFDRVLLDPPRAGALEVLPLVSATGAERLVYVSCHPGTLARDAGELVQRFGWRLLQTGVMDMFPHTAHVESIAVFVR